MTVFVDVVGLTIVLVGLPFRAVDLGASGTGVGLLVTCYSFGQLVSAPLLGAVSDRRGRRTVLLVCLAGSSASAVLTGLAPSIPALAAARLFAGACAGSIGIAYACAADAAPPDRLTRTMAALGASIGAAFVVGPVVGALTAGGGFAVSAWVAAGLAAANFAMAWIAVPETRPPTGRGPSGGSARRGSPAALLAALRSPASATLLLASLLATLAFASVESTLALLAAERFSMSPRDVGIVLAVAGVVMVLVQAIGVHRLARRWGSGTVATLGAAAMAGSLATLPLVPVVGLVAALCVLCAGYGLVNPTLAASLSSGAGADDRGGVLGANQAVASLARVVGPIAAGAAFDIGQPAPYFLASGFALAAAALVVTRSGDRDPAAAPASRRRRWPGGCRQGTGGAITNRKLTRSWPGPS